MKLFLKRLIGIIFIMIGIIVVFNYHLDNNMNELYYDNIKYTSNVILNGIDGFNFNYSATLNNVGDFYEIDFDVVNPTGYDMKIEELDLKDDDKYIKYSLIYENGDLVNIGDIIKNGESKTLKYIVLYENEVLENSYDFDSSFNINYKQIFS